MTEPLPLGTRISRTFGRLPGTRRFGKIVDVFQSRGYVRPWNYSYAVHWDGDSTPDPFRNYLAAGFETVATPDQGS